MNVIERNFHGTMGFRTCGNEDHVGTEGSFSFGTADCDSVGIVERGLAAQELNIVKCEVLGDAVAFHLDDGAFVVHEIVNGEIFLQRVIDAVETALLQAGKIEGGFTKSFAGDGSGVDAAAADFSGALDDRHALAEIGRLGRAFFSGRAAAYDYEVERFRRSHQNLRRDLESARKQRRKLRSLLILGQGRRMRPK